MRFLPLFAFTLWPLAALKAAEPPVDFNYDIRPIISAKCYHCHGPDDGSRKAGLRLDLRDEALKERDGIRAIVPGDLEASDLVVRICSHDKDEVMPPPKEGEPLTQREQDLLRRWVAQGAEYKAHWAWVPPVRPSVPSGATGTVHNAIDAFVLQKLAPTGLAQAPAADAPTLLRRLSLDLIGLPPTLEETRAFTQDTAPGAYERAVDRLLASPRFGEKWARMWLDLARYADSTGYGSDFLRLNIWPYRDWVISAFNRNLPYDQFTREQMAGDLLPEPAPSQRMATAFHRNTMTNVEGGTVDEEYRVAAVKDRIATTAQVWMGITLQCAQCHTHKFDPISHRDYYSFFAIFNQTEDNDRNDEAPLLPLLGAEETQRRTLRQQQFERALAAYQAGPPKLAEEQLAWEKTVKPEELPEPLRPILALAPADRLAAQSAALAKHYQTVSPSVKKLKDAVEAQRKALSTYVPFGVPIMKELPGERRRETRLLTKGNYLTPAEAVQPALLPAFGAAQPAGALPTRREVAEWLLAPENPLTARVAVNRFWAQLFGTGLVETEEDFGTQGALPTHPELLDWLAVQFRTPRAQGGLEWDVKSLLKLMVTSATYRQSSRLLPVHLEKDPRNRWLSHYPRRRLEAETVRDQALALAGLLSPKLGGPSVYPPQPDGLWRVAFNGGQNSYKTSTGEDRYRRGLYTIWRRTMPYPAMATFDAPSRESCTLRRQPTNTPLQAFVTLNDPCFVECAQALARRVVREGGATPEQRVRWALELVLGRPASEAQVAPLLQLLESELAQYRSDGAAAKALTVSETQPLPEGADAAELAAWTVVANVLLNLDGVLMKG